MTSRDLSRLDTRRRTWRVGTVLILGWVVASWLGADHYHDERTQRLYLAEERLAADQARTIADDIHDGLVLLQGIPVILAHDDSTRNVLHRFGPDVGPSPLGPQERKQRWENEKGLEEFDRFLDLAATRQRADAIWVTNAAGDCVAASNAKRQDSFVGENFSDREYFSQARADARGDQHAVGRASKLAGLFYSYPVVANGRFLGAVVVKRNLSRFADRMHQADAFIADASGVIVLAQDKKLESRTVPGAAVLGLSDADREHRYPQARFEPLALEPWGADRFPQAVRIRDRDQPIVLVSRALPEDGLTVYVGRPLVELIRIQPERFWIFALLSAAGALLIVALTAIVLYLRTVRQARRGAEAANIAKSAFLANMSQEIRAPMNGVLGMTEMLLEAGLNETQRRYAQTIYASAEALLGILNNIRDFSTIEAGRLELDPVEVDVRTLVEEALLLLAPQAHQKGLELASHLGSAVPERIRIDPVRLRQILLNLLGNALKFTEHGEVTVAVERVAESAGGAHASDCRLRFGITDSGVGMSAQAQSRLFGAFDPADSSTAPRFAGTGLGLAVSQQLVRLMGGEIGVDSEPGRGSVFWFTIRAEIVNAGRAAAPGPNLTGIRALIVEANATHGAILLRQVSALGADCELAADGLAGLEAMRAALVRGAPYHLALIDLKVPRMNGIELVRAVRADADLRTTRLAMMTSLLAAHEIATARSAGADAYLTKPVRREELFGCLARLTAARPADRRVALAQAADALDCQGARVLIAEDNPIDQAIARTMLLRAGCQVTIVSNGRLAVEQWREQPFELVLMDCQMPELDGLEATRQIRTLESARARVPIVALTAAAMDGDRDRCLAAGMDDYIAKPFLRSDLMAVLRRWIPQGPRPLTSAAERSATPGVLTPFQAVLARTDQ